MLDLPAEFKLLGDEVQATVIAVLESQQFINGPAVGELEQALCERVGVTNCVAVSSGTDALLCTLMALEIGAGDEVIVPSFTFFATAGAVWRVGAKPVFVDIDERTFNLDPTKTQAAITDRTKAIIAVHVFGQCAEMDAINEAAARAGVTVIEDAAQAIDASYHGRSAGTLGRVSCFSTYPSKNLGGFGEGGMILTSDSDLAAIARQLRNQGQSGTYVHDRVGGNFRLDTMKAAILLVKLKHLAEFSRLRRANASRYDEMLAGTDLSTPFVPAGHEPVYHHYSILTDRRDELATFLKDRGIATGVYYPMPLHLQPCFASLGHKPGSFPVAERTCERILSLPCHPMLSDDDQRHVAASVREFCGAGALVGDPVGTVDRTGVPAS